MSVAGIVKLGGFNPARLRAGQVDSWGDKAVDLLDHVGERSDSQGGIVWVDPANATAQNPGGVDYTFRQSIAAQHEALAAKLGTDPQGENITVDWSKFAGMVSTGIGTLPLTIDYTPIDVARLHTVLVPRIRRFAISTASFYWNPITTAAGAVSVGSTENPTLTTQDDTYTKATLIARGTSAVGVVTDLAQAVAGRPIQNEVIAAKLRALDVYEELAAYTGTGASTGDVYKGIETIASTNTLTASSLLTLDQLDTERAKIGKVNPRGYMADLILTDYSTWNTLAKQVNVQLRTSTPGAATSSRAEVGMEYPVGTTILATPHMTAASTSRVAYIVDTSVLAMADVMYRSIGQYARTTYQDTTGIQSWTAGIVDFSANGATGIGGLAHDVISSIT